MERNRNSKVFGVYQNEEDARKALESLMEMGYSSEQISVVSRSRDTDRIEGVEGDTLEDTAVESGLKGGAAAGAAIGGVGGLLAGLGLLTIPGIGPILAAGPVAATLGGILAGGAVGGAAGSIGGAIADSGVPEEEKRYIEERFEAGDIIIYVDADEDLYDRTSDVLGYRRWNLDRRPDENIAPERAVGAGPEDSMRAMENDLDHDINRERDLNAPDQPLADERAMGNDPYDPTLEKGAMGTEPLDPHVVPGTENPVNPADPLWSNNAGRTMTEEDRLRDEDPRKDEDRLRDEDFEPLNQRQGDLDSDVNMDHKNDDMSQDSNFDADEVLDKSFVEDPENPDDPVDPLRSASLEGSLTGHDRPKDGDFERLNSRLENLDNELGRDPDKLDNPKGQ